MTSYYSLYDAIGVIKDMDVLHVQTIAGHSIDYYYYNGMFYHLSDSYIPIYDLPLTKEYIYRAYIEYNVCCSILKYKLSKRYI